MKTWAWSFLHQSHLTSDDLNWPPLWHKFDTSYSSRRIRQHIFSDLSPIAVDLALRYIRITDRFNYEQANRELLDIHRYLHVRDLNLCDSLEELRKAAKRCAEKCLFARQDAPTSPEAYQIILTIVESYELTPPKPQNDDLEPTLNRICCEQWWFRKIKTLRLRKMAMIGRVKKPMVVILDNASIHTAKKLKPYWDLLEEKGMKFYFLPPYTHTGH